MSLLNFASSSSRSPGAIDGSSAIWAQGAVGDGREADGGKNFDMSYECPSGADVAVWQLENIRQFT